MSTSFTPEEKSKTLAFIDRALEAIEGGAGFAFLTANEKVVVAMSLLDTKERILNVASRKVAEGYTEDGAWIHPDSNGAFITWD